MKTNLKRMVALLLAVIICLSVAACSNAPSWDGKWEITDADYENMKIAKVISTENDGTRYVTLSAEDISSLTFLLSFHLNHCKLSFTMLRGIFVSICLILISEALAEKPLMVGIQLIM